MCGRVDLPGGNIDHIYTSLQHILAHQRESLLVFPGHNYTANFTSIYKEKKMGILKEMSKEEFISLLSITMDQLSQEHQHTHNHGHSNAAISSY